MEAQYLVVGDVFLVKGKPFEVKKIEHFGKGDGARLKVHTDKGDFTFKMKDKVILS
jgi:translation elongation factor P/translation initiation factor 5A